MIDEKRYEISERSQKKQQKRNSEGKQNQLRKEKREHILEGKQKEVLNEKRKRILDVTGKKLSEKNGKQAFKGRAKQILGNINENVKNEEIPLLERTEKQVIKNDASCNLNSRLYFLVSDIIYDDEKKQSSIMALKVMSIFMIQQLFLEWKKRYCAHFWGCVVFVSLFSLFFI
jgi:hypothetical protein